MWAFTPRRATHGRTGALASSLRRQAIRFIGDQAAGTMMTFALVLPVLMAAGGAAVDYSLAAATRSKMQAIADAAALAAARELQLARTDSSRITVVADNVIKSSLNDVTSKNNVDFRAMT